MAQTSQTHVNRHRMLTWLYQLNYPEVHLYFLICFFLFLFSYRLPPIRENISGESTETSATDGQFNLYLGNTRQMHGHTFLLKKKFIFRYLVFFSPILSNEKNSKDNENNLGIPTPKTET